MVEADDHAATRQMVACDHLPRDTASHSRYRGNLRRGAALKPSKSHCLSLAMLLALLATAVVAHHFSPLPMPLPDKIGVVDPGCDLQRQACSALLADGARLEFSIAPRPIPQLQPLRVEVSITGIQARRVEVDFTGESMSMGYIRPELRATTPGRFAAVVSLPVCSSGGMAWLATVMIETEKQRLSVPFRFETNR